MGAVDIETIEALAMAINKFEGGVVLVPLPLLCMQSTLQALLELLGSVH